MKYILVVEDGEHTVIRVTESDKEIELLEGKALIYLEPDWWADCDESFWSFACRAYGGVSRGFAQATLLRDRAELMAGIEKGRKLV